MDRIHLHFTMRTSFSFLLLVLLQTSTEAQICSAPVSVIISEDTRVDTLVVEITVQAGVTMDFMPPPLNPNNPFDLDGNRLIVARKLDYETETTHEVQITCTKTENNEELDLLIIVSLTNVNDNPPVFDVNPYRVIIPETISVNTHVGTFSARDPDGDQIQYTLTPESSGFKLRSSTIPDVLTTTLFDYDKVNNVELTLTARDTLFSTSTIINITIEDVDNRPPWFQPCTTHVIGGAVVCKNNGYTGRVVLNEQEPGALSLKPEQLNAIDGDFGINEEITYSFVGGDAGGLFKIDPDSGNITMLKPADRLETITLTVLAAQKTYSFQYSTTTVTISVLVKSLHPPQFQRSKYEAVVTGVGSMALDSESKDNPLQILATDEDYIATGGLNPHITYSTNSSGDFTLIHGYLFMINDLPDDTYILEVEAVDETNDDSGSALLSVEVVTGLTTTALPTSTMVSTDMTSIGESTTDSQTTEDIVSTTIPSSTTDSILSTTNPSLTTNSIVSTTNPSLTSEVTVTSTNPSLTSEGSTSTASTAPPRTVIAPSGGYGPEDMAAVGATLGILLLICLVVIIVLAVQIQKGKSASRKIYEASLFQSSLGQGSGGKEGIQYTNQAFQNDEDEDGPGFSDPMGGNVRAGGGARDTSLTEAIVKSTVPLHSLLRDDSSQAGSDKADSDKDVKPILTKERRTDDGYKSVWFKEDIDPNAKEEVVIIPDSREDDSEEEDEEPSSSGREDDEDDKHQKKKSPRVVFNDTDLDSGLGVKMGDPEDDSESDDVLTVDL